LHKSAHYRSGLNSSTLAINALDSSPCPVKHIARAKFMPRELLPGALAKADFQSAAARTSFPALASINAKFASASKKAVECAARAHSARGSGRSALAVALQKRTRRAIPDHWAVAPTLAARFFPLAQGHAANRTRPGKPRRGPDLAKSLPPLRGETHRLRFRRRALMRHGWHAQNAMIAVLRVTDPHQSLKPGAWHVVQSCCSTWCLAANGSRQTKHFAR